MSGLSRRVVLAMMPSLGLLGCTTGTPERQLSLRRADTGETATIPVFSAVPGTPEEARRVATLFRDWRTGETHPIDPLLIALLMDVHQGLDLPAQASIHLVSGFRSPWRNARMARENGGVAEHSFHTRGRAADIRIPGVPLKRIAESVERLKRGGFALYPPAYGDFVHCDTGPIRTWEPRHRVRV